MSKLIYLARDGSEVCCHCRCTDALITSPPQLDCPWCGCGWLFTCLGCRKAFTFARGIELETTWDDLAAQDLEARWGKKPSREDADQWIAAMAELLGDVVVGERYVCLDGAVLPVSQTDVSFQGWHSFHSFETLPHVQALHDSRVVGRILANRDYWIASSLSGADDER